MTDATLNIGLKGRLKHGDLLKVMDEHGWNQKQLGDALGLNIHQITRMINLQWVPKRVSPELAERLVALTGKLPEDLWPEWSRSKDFLDSDKRVSLYKPLTRAQLAGRAVLQLPATPEEIFSQEEQQQTIDAVLTTLTPREARVVRALHLDDRTQQSVAEELGVSTARVHQILAKGMRKLRHPSRSRTLLKSLAWKDGEPGPSRNPVEDEK